MQHRGETIQFRIPANPMHVAMIRRAIVSIASSLGFDDDLAQDIELSVAEALANAVEHGSPEHTGNVEVACRVCEDKLIIDVHDEGPGFALSMCQDPGLWSEHGRGLRMIYQLMDNVRVRCTPRGSRIRMVKDKSSHTNATSDAHHSTAAV